MEINANEGTVKYSKLMEENAKEDNEISIIFPPENLNKSEAKKLASAKSDKDTNWKGYFKTLLGFSFMLLIVILLLGVELLDTSRHVKSLKEIMGNNLKSQERTVQDFKSQNLKLLHDLEAMTNALNVSEVEIESLKQNIQDLIAHNQKIITDSESKNMVHENCSQQQEFSKALIEDLKLQNQNLTKDLAKIKFGEESLKNSISDESKGKLLIDASYSGNIDHVKLSLKLGANVNATEEFDFNRSALYYAAEEGHLEVVKILVQNGADVNFRCLDMYTPLLIAIKYNHFEIAEYLLQNGADPNARGYNNKTPLHYAAHGGFPKVVETLLKYGAREDLKNGYGRTPLQEAEYSKKGGYQQVIALLKN